jgi:Ca2+-binding EF-hand superfamily protein
LRDDFCRSVHIFLTMDELEDCFKQIGFPVTKDEIYNIFRGHNAHKTGYLPMDDFYAKLKCWKGF